MRLSPPAYSQPSEARVPLCDQLQDSFHPYVELIFLLNLATLTSQHKTRIAELASQITNWDRLFDLIETNAVERLSCQRLEEAADLSAHPRFLCLQHTAQTIKARTANHLKLLNQILLNLSNAGIDVIVLKGALFAHTLYELPSYKKMNDIDILVPFEQAHKASLILEALGFKCVAEHLFSKPQFSQSTHHSPPYVHWEEKSITGIHWGLHPKQRHFCSDIDGIWQRKIPLSIKAIPAYRMSWEDNLLHVCLHLPFYKIGVRELADVYNLILFAAPEIKWDVFLQRACEWNVCESVYRTLSFVNALLECVEDTAIESQPLNRSAIHLTKEKIRWVIESCQKRSSSVYIQDTQARIASLDMLLSSRSTHLAQIEKNLFIFRLSENYFEQLSAIFKMWQFSLFPPKTEMKKISYPWLKKSHHNMKLCAYLCARIMTPIRIIRALNYEHGSKTIFFLTVQNLLILLWETLTLSFLRRRPPILNPKNKAILKDLE